MSQCFFCGSKFRNQQSVRAHLKACTAYIAKKPDDQKTALGKDMPKGSFPIETAPMPPIERKKRPVSELMKLNEQLQEAKLRRAIKKIQPSATTNLLDLYKRFRKLKPDLDMHLYWERKMSVLYKAPGEPDYREWEALDNSFRQSYLQVIKMVRKREINLEVFSLVYLYMSEIRDRWERYRTWRGPVYGPNDPDPLEEMMPTIQKELAKIDDILETLRLLID